MSGVFRNIAPPHRPASVYPPLVRGEGHTRWVDRGWGGGSIVWKTPDTALCSIYVSTLWFLVIGDFLLNLAVPPRKQGGDPNSPLFIFFI